MAEKSSTQAQSSAVSSFAERNLAKVTLSDLKGNRILLWRIAGFKSPRLFESAQQPTMRPSMRPSMRPPRRPAALSVGNLTAQCPRTVNNLSPLALLSVLPPPRASLLRGGILTRQGLARAPLEHFARKTQHDECTFMECDGSAVACVQGWANMTYWSWRKVTPKAPSLAGKLSRPSCSPGQPPGEDKKLRVCTSPPRTSGRSQSRPSAEPAHEAI